MNLVTEQNLLGWTMNLHRESVSGRWGFSLGFRSTLPWSVGWFCTVDLNLYGYPWKHLSPSSTLPIVFETFCSSCKM